MLKSAIIRLVETLTFRNLRFGAGDECVEGGFENDSIVSEGR